MNRQPADKEQPEAVRSLVDQLSAALRAWKDQETETKFVQAELDKARQELDRLRSSLREALDGRQYWHDYALEVLAKLEGRTDR